MLSTKHLSRAVGGKLVGDIRVQVEAGEILAVVGPSGAGNISRRFCACSIAWTNRRMVPCCLLHRVNCADIYRAARRNAPSTSWHWIVCIKLLSRFASNFFLAKAPG